MPSYRPQMRVDAILYRTHVLAKTNTKANQNRTRNKRTATVQDERISFCCHYTFTITA